MASGGWSRAMRRPEARGHSIGLCGVLAGRPTSWPPIDGTMAVRRRSGHRSPFHSESDIVEQRSQLDQ